MGENTNELERLYLNGKKQAEQFKLLFDDVVPRRNYEDRVRLVGFEDRIEITPPAPERSQTAKALSFVKNGVEAWVKSINDALNENAQYALRFNDPQKAGFKTDKIDLTDNEKELFAAICDMVSRVTALREIIVDIENNNEQPRKVVSKQPQQSIKKIAYKLEYDIYKGRLALNGTLILSPQLDSVPDNAFQEAFKSPNTPVAIEGNMSSTIGNLKIPSALKEIMFRCSRGTFQVNPIITEDDLLKYGIDQLIVDQELQKLTK